MKDNLPKFGLKKVERLKSRKLISELFEKGQSKMVHPYRIVWLSLPQTVAVPAKMTVSVPIRHFKTAVKRNRIKRQIREVYRLNKQLLYQSLQQSDQQIAVMFIFVAKEEQLHKQLDRKMKKALNFLATQYSTDA